MTINERLEALEEKFGILEVVNDDDFGYEAIQQNVHSDTISFSWRPVYNPKTDTYDGETLDLDEAFDAVGVSTENKKLVNDAIREIVEDALDDAHEDALEQAYMRSHPYSY